jgi:SAM-dependent methyltransferase
MQVSATRYHGSAHVDEADLLPAAANCAWCGSTRRRRRLRLQVAPEIWLMDCADCHAASADRMPTEARLARYYASYYDDHDGAQVTVASPDAAAAHIARLVAPVAQRAPLRVLDFGGGDGALSVGVAAVLRNRGLAAEAQVDVVDYAAAGLLRDEPALRVRGHARLADLPAAARYDVVIASAILEHLPEPRAAMLDLVDRLAAGGRLYARTPWMAPLIGTLGPIGVSIDLTYPGHVHDLGGRFWAHANRLPGMPAGLRVAHSATSFVETGFSEAPVRTLAAHLLKLPSRLLGVHWPWVGGWEAVLARD